ncbi:hypothetical protein AJ80_05338 [Polytolypa hystricis UAMH7299]|uniref:Ubiquitin 3 binding protein But2 C-terminal domain-containing protein n=1 Tax=Polytolypa hystricis (strain UAMH7299) TaxID=1447883 RepID=A0A2B7Y533_POLH7|nr:hypothetical protein AJ80_05338 [Polytolypa hystricis UAMH7299]
MRKSIALAVAAAALANAQYQVSFELPEGCKEKPEFTSCPVKLDNAFLPSFGAVVKDGESAPRSEVTLGTPLFRAHLTPKEESTLTLFDMPKGFEDKECTLQFIWNGGTQTPADQKYTIWELEGNGADVERDVVWDTKPARKGVLAKFEVKPAEATEIKFSQKTAATFSEGPGFKSSKPTFPCPKAGKFAYEISSDSAHFLDGTEQINIAGLLGLGLEILDVPSQYDEDTDHSTTTTATTSAATTTTTNPPTTVTSGTGYPTWTTTPTGGNGHNSPNNTVVPPPPEGTDAAEFPGSAARGGAISAAAVILAGLAFLY